MTDKHSYQLQLTAIGAMTALFWVAVGYSLLTVLR